MYKRLALFCLGATLAATPVLADWEVANGSQIQFVSIKNNAIGEVSHFETLSGTVTEAGEVEVRVALDSVETNIGIRNERMKKLLFEVGTVSRSRHYRPIRSRGDGCRGVWCR